MTTITSANSAYAIAIAGVYTTPQNLQGYAADDAFSTQDVSQVETVMGIDGQMSAGYVFAPVIQTVTIMPNSPSLEVFLNWALAQNAAREAIAASATIVLPSTKWKYVLSNGYLTQSRPIPDAKRVLQAIPFQITWNTVIGAKI